MRLDYQSLLALSDGENRRTVSLSAFTLNLCLSLLREPQELFWWGELSEADKMSLIHDVANASRELLRSAMIGAIVWAIVQPGDAPDHWLYCDGSTPAMADYPELMDVYPSVLKNYPSSGVFQLPDMRGRMAVGVSADFNFLATGGAITHTLTLAQIPSHNHSEITAAAAVINGGLEAPAAAAVPSTGLTGNAGSGQPHNNMPPYGAAYWYMVAK